MNDLYPHGKFEDHHEGRIHLMADSASGFTARQRIFYFDTTRVVAIFMVVVLHLTPTLVGNYHNSPSWWWMGNLLSSLARPGVPLFLMVSGALLLNPEKEEPLRVFFSKRFRKVLIPFLAWSFIYILWKMVYHHTPTDFVQALIHFFEAPAYYHLWFPYTLIGIYLAVPILKIFIKAADEKSIRYFLALWLLSAAIIPVMNKAFSINIGFYFYVATGYIGYPVLGYYLHRYPWSDARRWLWIVGAVGALLITILGTYWLTMRSDGKLDFFLYEYLSPNVIIMAIVLFGFIKRYQLDFGPNHILSRLISIISSTSYSVYLMHIIILELLAEGILGHRFNVFLINPLVGVPVSTLIIVAISVILTLIGRKVPILKMIFQ